MKPTKENTEARKNTIAEEIARYWFLEGKRQQRELDYKIFNTEGRASMLEDEIDWLLYYQRECANDACLTVEEVNKLNSKDRILMIYHERIKYLKKSLESLKEQTQ